MRRGLVIGKFMPLHRGHQFLIDAALARCDDVTVVVYDTPVPGDYWPMPAPLRASWLTQLYPQLENIVVVQDPLGDRTQDVRDSPNNAGHYADGLAFLDDFDEVITSEPAYGHFANMLGAEHVIIDAARDLVPISGTAIREDIYKHRGWIDPLVYSSLIQKVVFVGTESTGKSTLAAAMAEELETSWVHEFGRELWIKQGGGGTFMDHVKMGRRQYEREQAGLRHARRYLFCDTNAWTTLQWSYMSYQTADRRLERLVNATLEEYIWIVCENDFGWVDDGVRELRDNHATFQVAQLNDLQTRLGGRGLSYTIVSGPVADRVQQVKSILGTS